MTYPNVRRIIPGPTALRFLPQTLQYFSTFVLLMACCNSSGCGQASPTGNVHAGTAENSATLGALPPPKTPPHAEMVSTDGDEQTFMVPMRDGVNLATYVYGAAPAGAAPDGAAPAGNPVILVRTPYGHAQVEDIARAAELTGYVVVVQDVRGRYASEGDFQMIFKEGEDGYDTIEWIAAQPWSYGKIGMFGMSYLGITQWAAAIESPPHLTCIFPIVAPSDYYNGMVYQDGALRQELTGGWLDDIATHSNWWKDHENDAGGDVGLHQTETNWRWHLPLDEPGPIGRGGPALVSLWQQLLDHPSEDGFWRQLNPSSHYAGVKV
ncbi:MAG: CocE/NonD family hydrolase, partial [Armatimonadota bacterium]|nr:CocE/NonD family hydrolase [Armatimonadota bacterium]